MTDLPSGSEALWRRVFDLAERGRYSTSPNPRVGAVVVDAAGRVVGEGSHERAGEAHAEVAALLAAGGRARGAAVYVNLEPCASQGRTPPCVDALLAAGVKRVVCSLEDPAPGTAGLGIRRLREGGVEVEVGPFSREAERLNEPFLTSVRKGRPFVHLKWGASLDGKTATRSGASRWISGEESREDAMRLREECDTILVGAGTVLSDDPQLTRRLGLNHSILPHRRIVLDGALRVSAAARVFAPEAGTEAWLVTADGGDPGRFAPFAERGVKVVPLPAGPAGLDLAALLATLERLEVRSLLVEGGGQTAWTFLGAGLVDRVTVYVAPLLIGGESASSPLSGAGFFTLPEAARLEEMDVARLGEDVRVTARVVRPPSS